MKNKHRPTQVDKMMKFLNRTTWVYKL